MIAPGCPLSNKDKLYVILRHECFKHAHSFCLTDCTFFTKRPLEVNWTIEMQQDLKAIHNINLEKEMVKIMEEEIQREIDKK